MTLRWRTATGWKSIVRWRWTRNRRDAPAPLLTPVVHGALDPLDLLRALLVVDKDPLAVSVDGRDALPALKAAQGTLRLLAVDAPAFHIGALLGGLRLFFPLFLLALAEGPLGAEVPGAVLLGCRRGRGGGGHRRVQRRRLHAWRRDIAVLDLAIRTHPFVLLRHGRRRECHAEREEQCFDH